MLDSNTFYRYYNSARVRRALWFLSITAFLGLVVAVMLGVYAWAFVGRIPGVDNIGDYELESNSRLHSSDGSIIKDIDQGSRIVVPLDYIPKLVQEAFISAEDQRFYEHSGVDFIGIGRAVARLLPALLQGRRPEGASTITQQVARNIVLNSSDLSLLRKFNEIIVALKLERTISKSKILELYLNQIFLGNRSYGVSAAAQNYFHKPLDKLSVDEIAFLAALPKGPNNYNPSKFYTAALNRRNWVADRMYQMGFISHDDMAAAPAKELKAFVSNETTVNSEYFIDSLRNEMQRNFPTVRMVGGGYSIRTSIDSQVQLLLVQALHKSLRNYDRRHGFRGPLASIKKSSFGNWENQMVDIPADGKLDDWVRAVVVDQNASSFSIVLENGERGFINYTDAAMGREYIESKQDKALSDKELNYLLESLPVGSVVLVSPLQDKNYLLEQIPEIQGAAIAIEPQTGRVLGEVGGWSYQQSKFNRASQGNRQPGSSIKPLVYLSALENGANPFSTVADTQVVVESPTETWIPDNFDGDNPDEEGYERPFRYGVERSRNRMTVRIAQEIGFGKVGDTFYRLGIYDRKLNYPSMVLGSADVHLDRLTRAYAILANGGKDITLTHIDRVQNRYGKTIARADKRSCMGCNLDSYNGQLPPDFDDTRTSVIDPALGYIVLDMMQGVVYRGTAASLAELGLNIAGKTGTTSDNNDSLFIGLLPNIVVGVWTGFDSPKSLGINPITGAQEAGSTIAVPVYKDFIKNYMVGKKARNFAVPSNIVKVRMQWDNWQPGYFGKTVLQPATARMIEEANQHYFDSSYTLENTNSGDADPAAIDAGP
ncbi:MAG: PBP1A family penicillin-binding protein [Alphaproteobacteria bacterium]|nr:PBP1A family penicillin-binding protein [Alphaproteobacteria bacterium]